jgi:hypothetical protein
MAGCRIPGAGPFADRGHEAYKPYVNHPAYDLVALNPNGKKLARISVKSRWAPLWNVNFNGK